MHKSGSKDDLERHVRELHQKGKKGEPVPSFFCPVPGCKRSSRGFARKANMEEHVRKMHPGVRESSSALDQFPVDGESFESAMSNSVANPSQQDLGTFDYSFLSPGNMSHIRDDTGFNSIPPPDTEFANASSHSTGQEARYHYQDREAGYHYQDRIAPNPLRSAIPDHHTTLHPTSIYDHDARGENRHDEDKLRKQILELEERKRQALLVVENMERELTTLREASAILSSYAGS
ncbi:hypothetical protein MMC26_006974 [Xylographa opegraphella]|nr:hypothetical protein [Xylographa opegraphella]